MTADFLHGLFIGIGGTAFVFVLAVFGMVEKSRNWDSKETRREIR
jgi:hypothetical protein